LLAVYRDVKTVLPDILKKRGAKSCYEAAVFRDLVYNAQKAAKSRLASLRRINLPAPAAYNLLRCQIANSRRRDFFPDRLAGARRPCSDAGCGRVRHRHTRYDELLMSGRERAAARSKVREEMDRVLDRWGKL